MTPRNPIRFNRCESKSGDNSPAAIARCDLAFVWRSMADRRDWISPSGITPLSARGRVNLTDATGTSIDCERPMLITRHRYRQTTFPERNCLNQSPSPPPHATFCFPARNLVAIAFFIRSLSVPFFRLFFRCRFVYERRPKPDRNVEEIEVDAKELTNNSIAGDEIRFSSAGIPKYRVDGSTGLIFERVCSLRVRFVRSLVFLFLSLSLSLFFFRKIIGRCVRFRNYSLRVDTVRRDINCTYAIVCAENLGFYARGIRSESFYTFRAGIFKQCINGINFTSRSFHPRFRRKETWRTILFRNHITPGVFYFQIELQR